MKELAKTQRGDGKTLHIIDRGTACEPFVVCWNFNGRTWDWGTYIQKLDRAVNIYRAKQAEHGFDADYVTAIN